MTKFRDPWEAAKELAPDWRPEALKKARQRGRVPPRWQLVIERAARERKIDLPPDFFEPQREDAA